MKVAWLAPYPVGHLLPELALVRRPGPGHPCSWIVNLSVALARIPDLELHLVTESQLVPHTQTVTRNGIHFHIVKSGIPFTNRGFPGWLPIEPLLDFKPNSIRLNQTLSQIKPDIVHAHGTEAGFARAGLDSGKPCLISIQGIIAEYQKTNPNTWFRLVEPCERRQVEQGQFFTCRTAFDSGFVRRLNPKAHIFQIQEAMNPVFFTNEWQPEDPPFLLFVGSICDRKGVPLLIEALPEVVARCGPVHLRLVGTSSPDYTANLRKRADQLGVGELVEFTGHKSAEEIADLHQRCRAYVLPTHNDNSPNTLAEAMVSGIPVVASRVGGIPSMIADGETGLLFESGNAQALAGCLSQVLTNPGLGRRLAGQAREVARHRHHPDSVATETVAAYRHMLAAG